MTKTFLLSSLLAIFGVNSLRKPVSPTTDAKPQDSVPNVTSKQKKKAARPIKIPESLSSSSKAGGSHLSEYGICPSNRLSTPSEEDPIFLNASSEYVETNQFLIDLERKGVYQRLRTTVQSPGRFRLIWEEVSDREQETEGSLRQSWEAESEEETPSSYFPYLPMDQHPPEYREMWNRSNSSGSVNVLIRHTATTEPADLTLINASNGTYIREVFTADFGNGLGKYSVDCRKVGQPCRCQKL